MGPDHCWSAAGTLRCQFCDHIPGAAEQVRQTRQLPDQCFDILDTTSGGTERPPPWIHSYVLGTRLEGQVYESSCIAAKLEVSGHIPGAC